MKIAVVTGASSGMGKQFALQLSAYEQVDEIWAIARRKEALEALNGQCGAKVRPVCLDLGKEESFREYAALLEQEKPEVKLLVNAAGFGKFGSFEKIPIEDEARMMAMNPGWVKTEFFNHAFQTNGGNEVQYFDRLYEARDVVGTGLHDLYKTKKDVSIHGAPVRRQVRLVKLLPHSLVMKVWLNQQKKARNNQGLTTK